MNAKMKKAISDLAMKNGYRDIYELLMDYRFIPSVLTPKHRKVEIVSLFLTRKKRNK